MSKRRNGVITDFNKLHWFWKLMLISGTFGVVHAVIRRAKGEPDYLVEPPSPEELEDVDRNQMPRWLQAPRAPYPYRRSAPLNDDGSWQTRWDRFVNR